MPRPGEEAKYYIIMCILHYIHTYMYITAYVIVHICNYVGEKYVIAIEAGEGCDRYVRRCTTLDLFPKLTTHM